MTTAYPDIESAHISPDASGFERILTGPLARWLFAVPFGMFGLMHFAFGSQMAGMVPVPGGLFWVYLTGVALVAAAVSVVTGKLTRVAGPLLALMLLGFVALIHGPGLMNEATMQMSMTSMLKDLALAGGALLASSQALQARR
jgi:putative oxidoreductase